MKRKPGRFLRCAAVFCALFLLLTVPSVPAAAAADIYFTSVNDKLLELTSDTMPEVVGGILYVPYTVFDGNTTGVNFGIFYSANKLQNTFVLYSRQKTLVFDLNANNSYDSAQNVYRFMAVTRNNKPYLPVSFVCDFFDLTYSYRATDLAPLIRIKNADAVLDDRFFISAATSTMQSRYNSYLLSLASSQPETPAASSGSTVTAPAEQPQAEEAVPICLSFLCSGGGSAETILDTLDSMNMYGLFLFPPDRLAENDDLIRRILGSGHSIGFTVADSGEASLSLLEEGNRTLRVIARTAAYIVYIPNLTDAARSQLEQDGWTCWTYTVKGIYTSGTSYSAATKIISLLEKQDKTVFLQMDDSTISAGALSRILRFLKGGDYTVWKVFETLLSEG